MRRLVDLYEKSNTSRGGDYLAGPLKNFLMKKDFDEDGNSIWVDKTPYKILKETPKSFKEVNLLTALSSQEAEDESENTPKALELDTSVLLPPSNLYTDAVPDSAENLVDQVDEMVNNNLVQQFYEAYLAPVGMKDVYNRLGTISGTIADIHFIYPNGLKGVIAADNTASWRTGINYSFQVDTGLEGATPETYNSLAFPPFINHSEVLDFQTFETLETTEDSLSPFKGQDFFSLNAGERTFDLANLVYRRGRATYRFPAFKQINDNIHLLQNFFTKCFGVENTFMNEWDLSMYIQEGLLQVFEKEDSGHNLVSVPQYVTTLTYGVLSDSPIKGLYYDLKDLDIAAAETYASVNMAISSRLGVDNTPLPTSANEQIYEISKYPYSAYWSPDDDGKVLKTPIKYFEKTYDDNDNEIITTKYEPWNVSKYIIDLLGYEDNGLVYANETTGNPTNRGYTFKLFRGEDLSSSKKTLLEDILYTDARNAILSGWNGTNENGDNFLRNSDFINGNEQFSNAYSYLPFWKQFFTSPEDGMSEVDKYMQEVTASGDNISWLTVASNIVDIITSDNTSFKNLCESKQEETGSLFNVQSGKGANAFYKNDNSAAGTSSFTDYSFKILKVKLTIPNSKLLKMFAKKDSQAKKAQQMANKKSDFSAPGGGPASSATKSQPKVSKPEKVVDEDGNDISTQVLEEPDALNTKQVEGVGIAEHSPFIYGGPHGMYYDPNTLEGYCQIGNRNLATVPTVDMETVFQGVQKNGVSPTGYSKNFKEAGCYSDIITVLTPNERYALLHNNLKLGVLNMGPNNAYNVPYTSNYYQRSYFDDEREYYTIKIFRHKIKIPKVWLWKISRFSNSDWKVWFSRWYNYSYSVHTRNYTTRSHTTRREIIVPVETDWIDTDFYLLPVTNTNLGVMQDSNPATIQALMDTDEKKFFEPKNLSDSESFDARTTQIQDLNIYYLLCPYVESPNRVNFNGGSVSSYSNIYSNWNTQCDHLWITGAREFTATLPIRDKQGNILNYLCGVVKVTESKVKVWEAVLTPAIGKKWHSRWHCSHYDYYLYYTWTWVLKERVVHNCFFMPNKILWNLPTQTLINQVIQLNTAKDTTSSDIVSRHKADDDGSTELFKTPTLLNPSNSEGSFNEIPSLLFPFSKQFRENFGVEPASSDTIPGLRASPETYGSLKLPRAKGFFYGDLAENFKKNNGCIKSITATRKKWDTWNSSIYFTDTRDARDRGGFLGVLAKFAGLLFGVQQFYSDSRWVLWTADNATNEATQFIEVEKHTKAFKEIQFADSVLANRLGPDQTMSWYKTSEAMDVYIETATRQLKWLQELKTYASLYFRDYLLVDLLNNSVDPIIKRTVKSDKEGSTYGVEGTQIGFTESWTEDLYYEEPLRMLLETYALPDASVEGVEQEDITNQNTLLDLIELRITQIEALKTKAISIREEYVNRTNPNSYEDFVTLVSNTWAILQQAKTGGNSAQDLIQDGVYTGTGTFKIDDTTTFDLVSNPGVALWSYLNLLYQVRKFWIKCRFNKQSGSYWYMRGLERVLVFMKASQTGITKPGSKVNEFPKNSENYNEKTNEILFVQSRTSILEQAPVFEVDTNPMETGAVYIKVNYVPLADISTHPDYKKVGNIETFRGRQVQYVDEVYKYCYLPIKGPYYVLSNTLIEKINSTSNQLTKVLGDIYSKKYVLTQSDVDSYFKPRGELARTKIEVGVKAQNPGASKTEIEDLVNLEFSKTTYGRQGAVLEVGKSLEASFNDNVRNQDLADIFTELVQALLEDKQTTYNQLIKTFLKKIYIKWDWHQVNVSLSPTSDGEGYIDEVQAVETKDKQRTITDLYGYEHKTSDELRAGITFNVAASLNPNILLGSTDRLQKSTVLETMCATLNTMDLWRIQIPEGLSINMEDLADKPVLVPAFAIEGDLAPFLSQEIKPTSRTVLAGAPTTAIVPVEEASEGVLTLNTLAALGKMDSIEIPTDSLFTEK